MKTEKKKKKKKKENKVKTDELGTEVWDDLGGQGKEMLDGRRYPHPA